MKEETKKVWSVNKIRTEESAGAVVRRCSVDKMFFKILQNSQENTCAGISALRPAALIKSNSSVGVFRRIWQNF